MTDVSDTLDTFQGITGLKYSNPSTTSAITAGTAATGKVQRPGLITGGVSGLLGLAWKLFILPISITGGIVGLITASIGLGFWMADGILYYSLSMIRLTSSGRDRELPPSPPGSVSTKTAAASKAIDFLSDFQNQRHRESPPSSPVSVSISATAATSEAIDFLSAYENRPNQKPPPSHPVSISESTAAAASASEAGDFLSEFENRYGKMHPNFGPENFTEAVQRSRREFKLLFVYLHSPDHSDTPSFCKETLCSEVLSAFVNENFVAWGDSISANGGLKMSKSLNASRFPFWAVIMAATGQSISLLRQFEGPASPEEMLKELQIILEESTSALVAARLHTDEHRKATELKVEQDAAYQAALEANQAKEVQNLLEREAELVKLCEEKVLSLGPEPEKGPDVTQVLVRLPNGERKGRRFHCNATLQSVYDFVDSSGCLEIGSYTLVSFFPRVLYGQDELSSTLEELGLYLQASLFVELKP